VSQELSGKSEDKDVEHERERILEQSQESLNATVLIKELKGNIIQWSTYAGFIPT
jgi:hypothetical protein